MSVDNMAIEEKKLYIVIGCDTDPDREGLIDNIPSETLSWRGLSEGIPETKKILKDIKENGNDIGSHSY